MSRLLFIAWKEFKSGFYSLRITTLLFLFTLFLGSFFFYYVDSFLNMQSQAIAAGSMQPKISQILPAYFEAIHFLFIFIVPSITMGIFAEERRTHTLRLYLASPVSSLEIVLGKYFGAFFQLLLILIASIIFPLYLNQYANFDIKLLISGYIGATLLAGQSLAFGLWISSLSYNQFTAFLTTTFGLFSFLLVSSLASLIRGQGFLHKTLKYGGMSDHYGVFAKGLITVADMSYFGLMSLLFLFFTVIAFEGFRWRA